MSITSKVMPALVALALSTPALAGGPITVEDAYMRTSGAMARSGAAFMVLKNDGAEDDTLIAASSDIAKRVELHTHIDAGGGVMQMREVEGGFPVPAGGEHVLMRGGDHVMFMGLTGKVEQGDVVTVTFTFENAGEMTVDIPVDLDRQPRGGQGGQMQGQGMQHGKTGG